MAANSDTTAASSGSDHRHEHPAADPSPASSVLAGVAHEGDHVPAPLHPTACLVAAACSTVAIVSSIDMSTDVFGRESEVSRDARRAPPAPPTSLDPPPPRA